MSKTKTREITIQETRGSFLLLKKSDPSKKSHDFSGILSLRQLLSNEKARILHVIKTQNPNSIYELAKKLNRGFKAVNDDLKVLEKFGFVELIEEKIKKRIRHKPVILVDTIIIRVRV